MFTRLMEIVNTMKSLGESFTDEMVIENILRILLASWNSPLAAIEESKDLKDYDLKEFLGSLMMYEATMFKKKEDLKEKLVAFKATTSSKKGTKENTIESKNDTSPLSILAIVKGKFFIL